MRINTLALLAVAFASHSAICASANQISSNLNICEGLECQKDNKVITRRLYKRQDPPPGDGSEISESFSSTIDPTNSFEPSFTSPSEPIDTNSSNNTPTSVSFALTSTSDSVTPSEVPSAAPTEVASPSPSPPTEVPPTTLPSSSPPPQPTSETPPPLPTSETPSPPPTSETPPPSPTSETPPPSPTSETPPPSPTSETPPPSPTSETPPPSPTSETPSPPPTSESPSPSPTSETPISTPSASVPTDGTTPTTPIAPGTSSDASASPSNPVPNPKPTDEKKESSNTGAIVGGVVGGIAVIAAIAGFIGYRYYQKKKQFSNVNFDFDDIAMSSPPPTAGFSGGSRLNAMNSTPATFPRNDVGAGAAIGAGVAAGSMARQQDSHYRPPSPNEYHSTSRPRQEYTNSQVSSQPSFASTDAFVDKNQRNQYSPERPSNNVAPTAHVPLNQFYNSDSPRSQRSDVDSPYRDFNQPQQVHRSESIPPMGHVQRNQDFNEFNASPVPVRQDNNRLAPDLARDNTFRSSVTSSSAGPGINEADLEETVIVGFGGGQANRSNSSLSNHSSERNLTHGLNTGPDLPLFTMTAIEPYMPERPNELLVQPDDELIITEEVGDQWFIGYNRSRNPEVKGYFPRNCVVGGYY